MTDFYALNTTASVIAALQAELKDTHPEVATTFDPSLSLETSVQGIRQIRSAFRIDPKVATYPFLAFSRAIYAAKEDMRLRPAAQVARGTLELDGRHYVTRTVPGSFVINFRLYASNPADLELYEVLYNTQAFLSTKTRLDMAFPPGADAPIVDGWPAVMVWGPPEDPQFQVEPVLDYSFAGQATVETAVTSIEGLSRETVTTLNVRLMDWHNRNLVYERYRSPLETGDPLSLTVRVVGDEPDS